MYSVYIYRQSTVDGDLTLDRACKVIWNWPGQDQTLRCQVIPSNPSQCGDTGATIPDQYLEAMYDCPSSADNCDTQAYPAGNSGYADTDLVIYITGDPTKDNTNACNGVMGFAAYCQSNINGRPIAGYINLCRGSMEAQEAGAGVLTWEESLALIIHETFHVLGIMYIIYVIL